MIVTIKNSDGTEYHTEDARRIEICTEDGQVFTVYHPDGEWPVLSAEDWLYIRPKAANAVHFSDVIE